MPEIKTVKELRAFLHGQLDDMQVRTSAGEPLIVDIKISTPKPGRVLREIVVAAPGQTVVEPALVEEEKPAPKRPSRSRSKK